MQHDSQIDIQDIECPALRSQMKCLVEDIEQLCPSDANVRASFTRLQDRFLAEIRVASETVCMQAMDSAVALSEVLEHVRTQMLNQIVAWRNHRFAS